ncbi:hypothetical protein [Paenibacillus xylanilyticus]|uniref:Uncharacterized protein n=1 Tax=Paenibacillus xylanilyticus TaxID=248903 RepID=A0A7Y6C1G3_9BACL|nr:hypothetical protein [Paenibacillus xylanilyticus]NUU78837.1 hypothetical protein [Paenibacillus xylanilyticus]
MKKTDWIKVLLVVSLFGNLAFFQNHERASRKQDIRYELLNSNIYRDLAQLEETIQYQIDNNWKNEPLVTQKLDDAIDSILLSHVMEEDKNKEDILWELHEYLYKFKYSEETFDVILNDEQRFNFIYLGDKLRSSGWNYGVGDDLKWSVFKSKVKELVAET